MRKEHDPIDQLRKRLHRRQRRRRSELKTIDDEVKAIVTEAADFAQDSPEPDPSELWTDVYAELGRARGR